ncbi:vWA domain-containing protein [Effusibacillus dendaii]|uniref:VWFA domain-containing protein n=1 Tax=Effusibacillus dendaii TaxID=2743772 RepID=A0A7I8DF88_9BACL|nr:hypothetical protein [Effusibacillus dendaii]BCJ87619.1 hypothetical protein skT53_26040 [Effusibacillus dendaii]
MKFLSFSDNRSNTSLVSMLTNLAKALAKEKEIQVKIGYHSYYSPSSKTFYLPSLWESYPIEKQRRLLKAELYLKAFGEWHFSDPQITQDYLQSIKEQKLTTLKKHLYLLLEEYRIETLIKSLRPGMKAFLKQRNDELVITLNREIVSALQNKQDAEAFYFSLSLLTKNQFVETKWDVKLPKFTSQREVQPFIEKILTENLLDQDMKAQYRTYEIGHHKTFDELKRKPNPKQSGSVETKENGGVKEKMPTWHRESQTPNESFLQFDINQGSSSKLLSDTERVSDSGDQVLAVIQGMAARSKQNIYTDQMPEKIIKKEKLHPYGIENQHAELTILNPKEASEEEKIKYGQILQEIAVFRKKLEASIQKMLEKKQNDSQNDRLIGRLGKKLIRFYTEENPRLFYKKQAESKQIDAAFSILVDCSSSMMDKIEPVQKTIALLHEVLKRQSIPHQISGFWEDGMMADEKKQPNYLKRIFSFQNSLQESGSLILQLSAKEDNRDGYIIRKETEGFLKRSEKRKFMIIFTDGEPAAFNYVENGIKDTYEAVYEARKKGMEVIGVFLSKEEITERDVDVMKNIYGRSHLVISGVEEFVSSLTPLLRKIFKQII